MFKTQDGETFKAQYEKGKFKTKEECQKVISTLPDKGSVLEVEEKAKKKRVPKLHNTLSIQSEATKKYRFSAKQTLDILQVLYEKKYITYPRTDATCLPEDMKETFKDILNSLKKNPEYNQYFEKIKEFPEFTSRHFNDKEIQDKKEDHHAIIPTGIPIDKSKLSEQEIKVYDLLCKSAIRVIYPDAIIRNVQATIDCDGKIFKATGNTFTDYGWCYVDAIPKLTMIPELKKDDILSAKFELQKKETTPPARYNDESLPRALNKAEESIEDEELAKVLKNKGIGRPSTTADIIERLVNRGYVRRKKNVFFATDLGIYLYEHLPVEDLKKADLTANWELEFDLIEQGKSDPVDFLNNIKKSTQEWCDLINNAEGNSFSTGLSTPCPICGKRILCGKFNYYCEGKGAKFNDCDYSIPYRVLGKKISPAQAELLTRRGKTDKLSGFTSKKDKTKKFDARLIWLDDEQGNPYYRVGFDFSD